MLWGFGLLLEFCLILGLGLLLDFGLILEFGLILGFGLLLEFGLIWGFGLLLEFGLILEFGLLSGFGLLLGFGGFLELELSIGTTLDAYSMVQNLVFFGVFAAVCEFGACPGLVFSMGITLVGVKGLGFAFLSG